MARPRRTRGSGSSTPARHAMHHHVGSYSIMRQLTRRTIANDGVRGRGLLGTGKVMRRTVGQAARPATMGRQHRDITAARLSGEFASVVCEHANDWTAGKFIGLEHEYRVHYGSHLVDFRA